MRSVGEGIFAIVKPRLVCSTWCLQRLKNVLGFTKKGPRSTRMGHGGTLDQLAGGVLIVGVGNGCKQLQNFLKGAKEYVVRGQLGIETPSLDLGTPCSRTGRWEHVAADDVTAILPKFRGRILQRPPMYSAKHKDGVRLYQLAHSGVEVERDPVPLNVYELELLEFEAPFFTLRVKCGSGFYVRQLVHEMGQELGCGAIAYAITRTRQGPFSLDSALPESEWFPENIRRAIQSNRHT